MVKYKKFITRKLVKENPDTLFVFGDNMIERGLGGQAKEMRGEPNAVGIPTKNYPGNLPSDFFRDDDYAVASAKIALGFRRLFDHAHGGGKIVWPADGIGTGLADLQNKAPKIWALIEENRSMLEKIK